MQLLAKLTIAVVAIALIAVAFFAYNYLSNSSVYACEINGAKYYYEKPTGADQFNTLYYENGSYLCTPSGGFAGGGARDCPDWVPGSDWKCGIAFLPPALVGRQ